MPTIDEADSKEAVDNQILLLEEALSTPFSYLNVVEFLGDVTDVDAMEGLTKYQKWYIHQKCQLLSCALSLAHEKMAISKNWEEICSQTVEVSKRFSIAITKSSRVVRNWYQPFCR